MKTIIETKRLIVREFLPSDSMNIFKLNSDKNVMLYSSDPVMKDIKEAEKLLRETLLNLYEKDGFGRWAVHLKANGLFIGWAGLRNEEDGVNLGIRFHKRFWNKGLGTEVSEAILNYGKENLGLQEIIASIDKENIASTRVVEKIGMRFEKYIDKGSQSIAYYKV